MMARLQTRCDKSHPHQHLVGGRAKDAASYPPELITEILRGIRDTADAEHVERSESIDLDMAMRRAGCLHDQSAKSLVAAFRAADLSHANAQSTIQFKFLDGRPVTLDLDQHFKDSYTRTRIQLRCCPVYNSRTSVTKSFEVYPMMRQ